MLTRRRLLGIAVIVIGVGIVVLATVRPNPFKDEKTIIARFDKVQGLGRIDRNVRVGGSNVGEIGKTTRSGDDILVELKVDPDIPVRKDARAELRPHTLFEGSTFVDLDLGTPNAPTLPDGGTIPKSQTGTYVSLDEATRTLNKDNRQAIKETVKSGAKIVRGEGVKGLQRTLKKAPALTRQLGPTARALQGRRGYELSGAIRGLARTSDAIASKEQQLVPFAARADRTLRAVDVDRGAALDAALVALPGALEEIAADDDAFVAIVDRATTLARNLKPAARELAPLLRGSRPLLRRATPIIRKATPLVAGLRTILARTADASPALRKAIVALRPGAALLDDSVLPALNQRSLFGLPTYVQLASAFAGGAAMSRSFQTPAQSPSPGHILRVSAYLDPQGTAGVAIPSCSAIALINKKLAAQMKTLGLCQ